MKYRQTIKITLIILILALGAFLRFENLGRQSYWMDEGYTVNAIISGIQNGWTKTGASILDSGQNYSCPMYCLPTAAIAKAEQVSALFLRYDAIIFRILSAVFGFLFIFVIYFFAKKFFENKNAGLLASFFTALSYYQIAWSRQARWYTELEVFFWLALFFFCAFLSFRPKRSGAEESLLSRKKIVLLSFSIFFTILAILTHKLAVLLPFIFITWVLIKNSKIKNYLKITKLKILIIVLLFLPFAIAPDFFLNTVHNVKWSYNLPYYLSFYLRNYWPFVLINIYGFFSADKETKKKHLMLWSAFFIYLIPLSFLTDIVHYRYLFHLTPIFFLAASLVIARPVIRPRQSILQSISAIILIIVFFLTGQGVLWSKNFYNLESDDPAKLNRPYYAYTPQPDWNKAYAAIELDSRLHGNDNFIVISSHPQFNKIFLNQAGYWIRYDYLGFDRNTEQVSALFLRQTTEYYANAEVINNLEELKKITEQKHGYLVFDYQSADGRVSPEILNYIQKNFTLSFYDKINSYSQLWVYKF